MGKILKSEKFLGHKITFRRFSNNFIEAKTDGIIVGAFKTKQESFDYIKKRLRQINKGWKYRNTSGEYFSLKETKKILGV